MVSKVRRRVLTAVAGAAVVAGVVGVVVASTTPSSTPSATGTHPKGVPSETHPSTSPVTTLNPKLLDRQPPAGKESTILPAAADGDGGGGTTTTPSSGSVTPEVVIPKLGVKATVVPEGIDRTPGDVGNLAVPSDVAQVGWWDGGPNPGQAGTAVFASHRAENGVFWTLPNLHPGDAIEVTGSNGQTTDWKVSDVQQLLKADLPDSVWDNTGTPKLALVTCGGQFNYSIGHYNDNVIVWATPA